ncbi:MAG TPA: adenosylcobalamin-dependent ribonucleoside-diphosphate reductase [Patescibacteria group bacterium]|nr:adenosylcobalamin-dependent ribonucleoside-diphosphate reductase [Patescibacteria group bacterium]
MSNPTTRSPAPPLEFRPGQLTAHALRVLEKRYLARDVEGRTIETPDEMFLRVARNVARPDGSLPFEGRTDPEATATAFYGMMSRLEFLPNSPTLMNAGRDSQQLCACFVLPIDDSMEGIFESLKQAAIIHKTGGGTGFNFSHLRPRNSRVRSTSGVASGPVSFMKVFNAATEAIKQGGTRRGANMGILRVDHPDILEFIDCKKDGLEIVNFNISVALTDAFMQALTAAGDRDEYDLIDPRDGSFAGRLRAREVFDRIVDNAWLCGDPGVIFIDRINQTNPTLHTAPIEATNPCGEQPLSNNEACTLGSVNLGVMLNAAGDAIDYDKLAATVRQGVHFLDNVIEATRYPVAEIERITRANRRIGLGVMGWADLLIALGIPYDSDEAVQLADRVMSFVRREARKTSAGLAQDRGAFPNFTGSLYDVPDGVPLRNATTTTIAPTGTISIIAGASSGIEPLYAVAFSRGNVLDLGEGERMYEVHPQFMKRSRELGILDDRLLDLVASAGSLRLVDERLVPGDLKRVFVTAHDLSPEWHVRMQAAFQRHCDNGVSKTVNLATSATPDDVRRVFLSAFDMGCKGVTVYRDRSRARQVLHKGDGASHVKSAFADLCVTMPSEVTGDGATLGRLMSRAEIRSLKALGAALNRRARGMVPVAAESFSKSTAAPARQPVSAIAGSSETCPDCGSTIHHEAGCLSCHFCGYSRCN